MGMAKAATGACGALSVGTPSSLLLNRGHPGLGTVQPLVTLRQLLQEGVPVTNKSYVVFGDMSADRASENYPTRTLCDECVAGYEVVAVNGPEDEPCEDCGDE